MDKILIINEIMKVYNFRKYGDFADFLGIKQQVLSNWIKRNTFDLDLIYTKCDKISPDWLISGSGEMLREVAIKSNFNPEIEKFLNLKSVFSEIFERLEKLEQNTDGLAIGHTVNQEIAKIIDEKIIEKK